MTDSRQRTIAIRVGLASALVAAVCTAVLIADHLAALSRADDESQLVEALREQVGTDHEVAAPLHEERERQTDVSMAREARSRTIAWVLLVAGGVSVACGRWYMSRRPQPLPSLDRLVAERFPPAKQPVHRGVSAGVNAGVEAGCWTRRGSGPRDEDGSRQRSGSTQPAGMHRRPNAAELAPRCTRSYGSPRGTPICPMGQATPTPTSCAPTETLKEAVSIRGQIGGLVYLPP